MVKGELAQVCARLMAPGSGVASTSVVGASRNTRAAHTHLHAQTPHGHDEHHLSFRTLAMLTHHVRLPCPILCPQKQAVEDELLSLKRSAAHGGRGVATPSPSLFEDQLSGDDADDGTSPSSQSAASRRRVPGGGGLDTFSQPILVRHAMASPRVSSGGGGKPLTSGPPLSPLRTRGYSGSGDSDVGGPRLDLAAFAQGVVRTSDVASPPQKRSGGGSSSGGGGLLSGWFGKS